MTQRSSPGDKPSKWQEDVQTPRNRAIRDPVPVPVAVAPGLTRVGVCKGLRALACGHVQHEWHGFGSVAGNEGVVGGV